MPHKSLSTERQKCNTCGELNGVALLRCWNCDNNLIWNKNMREVEANDHGNES
jgi:hypothetical protein